MLSAILFGVVTGSRAMTGMAVLCWFAMLEWVPLDHTWASWTGKIVLTVIFSLAALSEYVFDVLPSTPSRKLIGPFVSRIVLGALCGAICAAAILEPAAGGAILGAIGAVVGTYSCYAVRMSLAKLFKRDLPAGLLESLFFLLLAIAAGILLHHDALNAQALEFRVG
ncbi:MAG: DUF4126 domain-containing protein [Acidobacteriaceae bacterium]|nr:DUF4126 domain-containing protein [Acidobacteriaceae bacterium]